MGRPGWGASSAAPQGDDEFGETELSFSPQPFRRDNGPDLRDTFLGDYENLTLMLQREVPDA